ncbi:MAG: cellulase family glycosylhydrolase [Defluviitaleaceae bacterium]|nr:cellulase family glycosylhydrolase [Defluviitaleaceae bacterium]
MKRVIALQCEKCGANLNPQEGAEFITCEYCGVTKALVSEAATPVTPDVVFAKWSHDGYYYPATIGESFENHVQALFLDGDVATVDNAHVIDAQHALDNFALEANWKNQGGYFKGRLSGRRPMIMNYDDGDVEQVEMRQLRGARPGEHAKFIRKSSGCLTLIVATLVFIFAFATLVLADESPAPPFEPVTGWDMMERLGVGINIGNTMESSGFLREITQCPVTELETTWGNAKIEQWHMQAIAAKGFDSVRIPINWSSRMNDDLIIYDEWMDRVQEVVDWALYEGLYVIINTHHERDLYDPMHYGPFEDAEDWLLSVWTQISERFKYYPESLIFEPMNEPRPGLDGWFWCDDRFSREIRELVDKSRRLNESVLEVIRNSGGYNDRRVVMLATFQGRVESRFFTPPPNDPYIMLGGFLYPRDEENRARELRDLAEIRAALDLGIAMVIKETSPYSMNADDALDWAGYFYPALAELGVPVFWWNRSAWFAPYELLWRNAGEWNYPLVELLFDAYGKTPGPSLPRPPIEFPYVIATHIDAVSTTWTQGAGFGHGEGNFAIPSHILYAADFVVVEFSGRSLRGDFEFTRWHPSPWTVFRRNDPRIRTEPGRIIFDMRGLEGFDFGFALRDERDISRIARIFLKQA